MLVIALFSVSAAVALALRNSVAQLRADPQVRKALAANLGS